MLFSFKKIDKSGFQRIWDSDFQDGFSDSHPFSFNQTPESSWKPTYIKHLEVMHEVILDNETIGYVFLSPKDDGSAHLGYGIYQKFRGRGYSIVMCEQFLEQEIPKLNESITKIVATVLCENKISQRVLIKLGFELIAELEDSEFNYYRFARPLEH